MKKTLLLATLVVAASLSAFGQGVVNFNNRVNADVNGPLVDAPIKWGGTGTNIDGSVTYANVGGGNFLAALYGAPGAAQPASSLVMLANPSLGTTTVPFRSGAPSGYVNVGSAGARTIPGAAYGSQVTVQVRVWNNAFPTYEAAVAAGGTDTRYAASSLITMGTTTGPTDQVIPRMVGLQTFVVPVPEPSTIALGLLGLGAVTLFRRRK